MKKWLILSASAVLTLGAVLWSLAQIASAPTNLSTLFPGNALLYIEAKNFQSLLKDWNSSEEKHIWLEGDNYAGFSRSRLFERLSQAQSEFSAAASISADDALLSSVSGTESALAVYDIGNLQFLYITRMPESSVEATPLWQVRDKFEQRTEGTAQFYVHVDAKSNRTAAFAARDGWLILGTRESLIAGALDRLQGAHQQSLPDEPWYADSLKQAPGAPGELRMMLNLEKLVSSPYFRSYWVQRNISEMKQYRAAICDLHRGSEAYREDRILLRKSGISSTASGDVKPLLALAPEDAAFSAAQASPDVERALELLRENLLDVKPVQQQAAWISAPALANSGNAGATSAFEERIDTAPVIATHSDPYQPLRALLTAAQTSALLETYTTRSTSGDMFVGIDSAVVLVSPSPWDKQALQSAISAALRSGLTASQLGVDWMTQSGANGAYASLSGEVPLHLAVRGNQLFLSNSDALLEAMLSRDKSPVFSQSGNTTYSAVFQHTAREQQSAGALFSKLDSAGHGNSSPDVNSNAGDGQAPPFFSGNVLSLSRMFSNVDRETIDEQDSGAQVTQTVVYRWRHS